MPLELDDRQRAMLQEMGVQVWLPGTSFAPEPVPALVAHPVAAPVARVAAPAPVQAMPAAHVASLDWHALEDATAVCQACSLCAGRKNSTLSASAAPAQADWMVVGDPPDEDEDRAGTPFAEQAGILLDNMLKAVGARRNGIGATGAYLSNVVKCRPPHGRIPQAAELAQCAAFLNREIALVQPRMILAMGRFANQLILSEQPELASLPLGKLRGTVYHYRGVPVVVTYHPKVLLRASADKAKAWADLCLAMKSL